MPTVADFITNDITNPPVIPPGLQAIVDKVLSRSTMARGEREAAAAVAGPALAGVTAQGVQRRGLMETTRMTEAGLTSRLGLTGQQAMEQKKLGETGATERAGILSKAPIMEQERKAQPIPSLGLIPPVISPPPEIPVSWWEKNKESMFNF